jgi:ATP-dependent Clp protease protease subunit
MRRYETREQRFSKRTLLNLAAMSLPETLALRAASTAAPAEILLYDEIGYWGVTASDFTALLAEAGDGPLNSRINSPGGDVFDGYAIYNALRARKAPVNVFVDGLAASIASVIAMAGTSISMAEPSMLMIHNASGGCLGDRKAMQDMAAVLEKIDGQIAAVYAGKCGRPVGELAAMMDAETWLTSADARAASFCDQVAAAPGMNELNDGFYSAVVCDRRLWPKAVHNHTGGMVQALNEEIGLTVPERAPETVSFESSDSAQVGFKARRRLLRLAEAVCENAEGQEV